MIEINEHIAQLILKYAAGVKLDVEESFDLQEWRTQSEYHYCLPEKFRDEEWVRENVEVFEKVRSEKMWNNITGTTVAAILCSKCRDIIRFAINFTDDERKAMNEWIPLPEQYCETCREMKGN